MVGGKVSRFIGRTVYTTKHCSLKRNRIQNLRRLDQSGGFCFWFTQLRVKRELKQQRWRQLRKRHLKSEFALLHTFHPYSSNVCNSFWSWVLKDCIKVQEKKKKVVVLCSSPRKKREIRYLHVVVVQWRLRNVQKSVMHVPSCCFANINLLPFWRSRCRRRRQKRYQHFPVALRHESEKITWSVNLAIERFHSRTLQLCQY